MKINIEKLISQSGMNISMQLKQELKLVDKVILNK